MPSRRVSRKDTFEVWHGIATAFKAGLETTQQRSIRGEMKE
jgi:hypothetical protein